jgi:hypothetical protein
MHLDGNAAAGDLSDVFAFDPTTALATCAGCGRTAAVADARAYASMGLVLRCPGCDGVLLRLLNARGELRVELRGISLLRRSA